jgi:hypothetical protein
MASPEFLLANEAARETLQQAEELRRCQWERRDQQNASLPLRLHCQFSIIPKQSTRGSWLMGKTIPMVYTKEYEYLEHQAADETT